MIESVRFSHNCVIRCQRKFLYRSDTISPTTPIDPTSLAVNRKKGEEPDWFSLELWNKQAEVMANYCQKGSLISVQGELKLDEWIAQDGTPRSKVVIKVSKLELLATGNNNQPPTPTAENYNDSDI